MATRDRITLIGLMIEGVLGFQRVLSPAGEAATGVGGQAFSICIRLYRSEGGVMRMADLATQTGISPSGLTRAIDRLVDEGMVAREVCPSDRRGSFAVLTPSGRERMEGAIAHYEHELDELLGDVISPDEEAVLGDLLERLRNRVNPEAAYIS